MHVKKLFAVGFGLLIQLTSAYAAVPPSPGSSENTNPTSAGHCDINCAHRLIFRTAYASVSAGFGMVFNSCNVADWCVNTTWCPNTINATMTKVAAQAKTDTTGELDYNNFNNLTLLSAMSTVSARSTRMAISVAQSTLKSFNQTCDKDQVVKLERMRWLMSQHEGPIDYDADQFERELAAPVNEPHESALIIRGDGDDKDDTSDYLQLLWALSAFPIIGLSAAACDKWGDFVLCRKLGQLAKFFSRGKKLLPKDSMIRSLFENMLDPTVGETGAPTGPSLQSVPPNVEPVASDVLPQPVEAEVPFHPPQGDPNLDFLRNEMYDPVTGQAVQGTLRPNQAWVEDALGSSEETVLRPYDVLGSEGESISELWLDPATLSPMPGEWAPMASGGGSAGGSPAGGSPAGGSSLVSGFAVRQQVSGAVGGAAAGAGAVAGPLLTCVGEPVVAAGTGTLMTMAPVAVSEVGSALGRAGSGLMKAGSMLFDMFTPEGSSASEDTVIYNPHRGEVDVENIHDDHESQNDRDDEHKEDHDEATEPHSPPTTMGEATNTHHDHATPQPTATPTQHPDHGKPSNPPNTHQPTQTMPNEPDTSPSGMPTTLTTMTTMWKTKTETATKTETKTKPQTLAAPTAGAFPAPNHVSGCKTLKDCPCGRENTCQIGDLPSGCNIGAMEIEGLPYTGDITWDECVDKINNLDRQEAKAWVASITLPYCLSGNEWEPKDNSEQDDECYLTVHGEQFARVRDVYIDGMLPLKCPARFEIEEARGWRGVSEDVKQRCEDAAMTLERLFQSS